LFQALNAAMREVSGLGVMYSQAVAARLGVNSSDLECLDYVVMRGPITAGSLAEATGLTTGAITGTIDRLERAGFAARESDPADRRKVLVRALPAVEKRIAPLFEPMGRAAMAALSSYSNEELALLLRFLAASRDAALAAMKGLQETPAPRAKSGAKSRADRSSRAGGSPRRR
jgi:DNA-binding MarR family transcriptional regulator